MENELQLSKVNINNNKKNPVNHKLLKLIIENWCGAQLSKIIIEFNCT